MIPKIFCLKQVAKKGLSVSGWVHLYSTLGLRESLSFLPCICVHLGSVQYIDTAFCFFYYSKKHLTYTYCAMYKRHTVYSATWLLYLPVRHDHMQPRL
jgi:hypothetical protein